MKPIVHCHKVKGFDIRLGCSAIVKPIDHPSRLVSNQKPVITSKVIALSIDGFETENTMYVYLGKKD